MKRITDATNIKGIAFIVAGIVLLIFFAGWFLLYTIGIIGGIWLLGQGFALMGMPAMSQYIDRLITALRSY